MEWVEIESRHSLSPRIAMSLFEQAAREHPNKANVRERLGQACFRQRFHARAAEEFERALSLDAGAFRSWADFLEALLHLGHIEQAIAIGARGESVDADDARLLVRWGQALKLAGRGAEARTQFERALALGDHQHLALKEMLGDLARGDGNELLRFCEALPTALQDNALVRANIAIAYSRLGRFAEARDLVDLERHVARVPFSPPAEFGGIGAFNRRLAAEILREVPSEVDYQQLYLPETGSRPALAALLAFIRASLEDYLDREWEERGLQRALPPRPSVATLYDACTILRRSGSNGEHVHAEGYVSTVYHVLTPRVAQPPEGALLLGACENYTGGYAPCWGRRYVEAAPGYLTIFPSQIFHDVVPTGTDAPRISVAADLRAVA